MVDLNLPEPGVTYGTEDDPVHGRMVNEALEALANALGTAFTSGTVTGSNLVLTREDGDVFTLPLPEASPEAIEAAVTDYLTENPPSGATDPAVAGFVTNGPLTTAALTAQIGNHYDIAGNVTSSQVQAVIDSKSAGRVVSIGPGTITVTSPITINGQLVKCAGTIFKAGANVTFNNLPRIINIIGDRSQLIGPFVLDGNRTQREANGAFPTNAGGIQGLDAFDVRDTRVADGWVIDVGSRSDVEPMLRTFGAFALHRTFSATQDVYGNKWTNLHLLDPNRQASFLMRYRTDFDNLSYGQQGYYLRDNSLKGGSCVGVGKNPIELAGPDTIFNEVADIDISATGGDAGADCAYGASWNTLRNIVVRSVNPRASMNSFSAIECSALDKRGEVPGYTIKRTRGNKIIDCVMRDTAITRDGFFLRGFSDCGGIGNEFIRPRVESCTVTGTGSNVAGISFIPMGYTDSTEELVEDCHLEQPDFRGVTNGIRTSTGRVLRLTVSQPYIDASGDAIAIVGSFALDRPSILGGYVKAQRFWPAGSNIFSHLLDGVEFYYTGDATPLPLGVGSPGRVIKCHFNGSGNPSVVISRTTGFVEIIENNTFVRIGMNAAALAAGGRAIIRGNVGVDLTTATHRDTVPAEVFTDTGAAPTTGTWQRGDKVINRAPVAGSFAGWVCVTGGTPGTWQPFGFIEPKALSQGTAAPTTGTWARADRVINSAPSPGGFFGWVCTSGGSPGTWKGYGLIES